MSEQKPKSGQQNQTQKPATPWAPMRDAPRDGRPIWLRSPGGEAVECYWRNSRKYNAKSVRWEAHAYWSRIVGPPGEIEFEPGGWFRPKDNSRATESKTA